MAAAAAAVAAATVAATVTQFARRQRSLASAAATLTHPVGRRRAPTRRTDAHDLDAIDVMCVSLKAGGVGIDLSGECRVHVITSLAVCVCVYVCVCVWAP